MENAMHSEDATEPCMFCGYVEGKNADCPHDYVCDCRVAKEDKRQKEINTLKREQYYLESQIERIKQKIKGY